MENSIENNQICRLCMEGAAQVQDCAVLVDIFSDIVNEPGKSNFSEKLLKLYDLKIARNDGLPTLVCHKCLVFTDNCFEFREKCLQNDQTLRQIFKVVQQESIDGVLNEEMADEVEDEYEEEIIAVDPNQLYESSSDESVDEAENTMEQQKVPKLMIRTASVPPQQLVQVRVPPVPPQIIGNDDFKREIYHCRYCDVVFLELEDCSAHEERNHDYQQPFECAICHFKCDTHHTLMGHIKFHHSPDKPHICSQCKKNFIRRADLRKHTFVHAGIRLYSCDICKKSFTHKTNLNKHKRTHTSTEPVKTFKCKLCPQSYFTSNDLSNHLEIHMDRAAMACKYCNEAFLDRDELEIHQKSHFDNHQSQLEVQQSPQAQMYQQPSSIGFYNQIVQEPVAMDLATHTFPISAIPPPPPPSHSSMNFYTESSSRHSFPIINQLLTGMQPIVQPDVQIKKFVCGICNSTFNKKKEHDRHVTSIHTSFKQFHCEKCPKTFSRKDKLLAHERTHVIPTIFNCSLCPAVFMRQQMLDIHTKAHQFPNGGESTSIHIENFLDSLQALPSNNLTQTNSMPSVPNHESNNGFIDSLTSPDRQLSSHPIQMDEDDLEFPMNLSASKPEVKMNSFPEIVDKISLDSDDDDNDGLHIIEEPMKKKNATVTSKTIKNIPELKPLIPEMFQRGVEVSDISDGKELSHDRENENADNDDSMQVKSKISDMTDRIEPLHDLPMEILNN